ncbi:hypothetical protein PRIPAC_96200 [Pristionchus pacificus]|uniref:Uncharacterized protein n=1 Tax=Pristionchus pacificus TaxID=54126 RepID=A0A2A6CUI3_PRIPA|nr:hypothetical protein PRIPAC_96200 [Pristionchus pacificus]|eukprot:PDM81746.1 hypothetical protein PRIPAC_30727 [Pristionchus pacificus]
MIAYLLAALLLSSSIPSSTAKVVDQDSTHPLSALDAFPLPDAEFFVFPTPSPLNIQLTSEDKLSKDKPDIV